MSYPDRDTERTTAATAAALRARLEALGYTPSSEDDALLSLCASRTEEKVRSECGLPPLSEGRGLPDALVSIASDMAAGEFLSIKRAAAPDELAALCASPTVKQITVGDTSTAYAVSADDTPDGRLLRLISLLTDSRRGELSCYRKIRW